MDIYKVLIKADTICDYVPGVSTISNLVDLFQKCFTVHSDGAPNNNKPYYKYLKEKSTLRCVALLIPGVGNFIVGLYDWHNKKYSDKDFINRSMNSTKYDGAEEIFQKASSEIKKDEEFILQLLREHYDILKYVDKELLQNKQFMIKVAGLNCLDYIDCLKEEWLHDPDFLCQANDEMIKNNNHWAVDDSDLNKLYAIPELAFLKNYNLLSSPFGFLVNRVSSKISDDKILKIVTDKSFLTEIATYLQEKLSHSP